VESLENPNIDKEKTMLQIDLKGNLNCELSNLRNKGIEPSILTTAIRLPTGAIEVITNTQNIIEKIDYLNSAYDYDFKLKTNSRIQIIGFMLV
jgi:hypothetical protein